MMKLLWSLSKAVVNETKRRKRKTRVKRTNDILELAAPEWKVTKASV